VRSNHNTIVVPAHAGTHNHRAQLLKKVSASAFHQRGRGVWFPAFAGTTLIDKAAGQPHIGR
jgi:hypothetical protein